MKLAFFDDFRLGPIQDEEVADVSGAVTGISHTSPQDLINQLIGGFAENRSRL